MKTLFAVLGSSVLLLLQTAVEMQTRTPTGTQNGPTYVDGVKYKTLSAAVSAAKGTVIVPPGLYSLPVTVTNATRDLEIECMPGAVIAGASASITPLIKLTAPSTSVRGCQFQGQAVDGRTRQVAVEIGPVNNVSVTNNVIAGKDSSHGFNNGVQIDSGASGAWIERNTVKRLLGTTSGVGYGILLIATSGNHIQDNHVVFSTTQGRHQIYISQNSSRNEVSGNILEGGTNTMISVFARDSQGSGAQYNKIYFNILRNGGNSASAPGAIGLFNNVCHTSVMSNIIIGIAQSPGIELWDAGGRTKLPKDNRIANNRIENTGTFGIEVVGASRNKISGNRIYNSSTLAPNTYDGILIAGDGGPRNADRNQVTDNHVAGSARYSLNIGPTAPPAASTIVTGNTLGGAYNDSGSGTILAKNLITKPPDPRSYDDLPTAAADRSGARAVVSPRYEYSGTISLIFARMGAGPSR